MRYLVHGAAHVVHCNFVKWMMTVCRVSDAGVRHLVDGPCSAKLRELNLTNCIRVGDMAMVNIHKRSLTCFCLLPNLHALMPKWSSFRPAQYPSRVTLEYCRWHLFAVLLTFDWAMLQVTSDPGATVFVHT